MPAALDLTGQRFGRLVVIRRDETAPRGAGLHWVCRCDCGREMVARGSNLRGGNTRSCGCMPTGWFARDPVRHQRRPASRPDRPSRTNRQVWPDDVAAMRAEYAAGNVTQAELASKHGVSKQRISQILKGQ